MESSNPSPSQPTPGIEQFAADPAGAVRKVLDQIEALPTTALRVAAIDALPSYVLAAYGRERGGWDIARARSVLRNTYSLSPHHSCLLSPEAALFVERMAAFMRREGEASLLLPAGPGVTLTIALS